MYNGKNHNPLLSALFSKESLTFIKAQQAWQARQWQALMASNFPVMFLSRQEPPILNPKNVRPKLSEDETPKQE